MRRVGPVERMAGEDEIRDALERAEDAGPPEDRPVTPLDFSCAQLLRNDLGNKDRLMARHGADIVFTHGMGWGDWTGAYWDFENGRHRVLSRAADTSRAIYAEARSFKRPTEEELIAQAEDEGIDTDAGIKAFVQRALKRHDALVEAHLRHARSSGNSGKLTAMLDVAEGACLRPPDAFDARPFIFNAANRALHLKADGSFDARPHARGDLMTKLGGCDHDEAATAPQWEAFLERMQPDPAMRAYLQRVAGYMLTGDSSEQAMFIFWGSGRNGKGTCLNAWRNVLGKFAVTSPIETFGEARGKDGGGPRPDIVRLRGARMTATGDAPSGFTLNEAIVKQATGEEPITARDLNKGFLEFLMAAKVVVPSNPLPRIVGTDDGIWRRVNLVPWPVQLTEADVRAFRAEVGDLPRLLAAEASGILNWMLEGYRAWRREGLNPPEAVKAATADYRSSSDQLGEFLQVWTERRQGGRASAADLIAKYAEFCKANAYPEPKSPASFGKALKARGFDSMKSDGRKIWLGLALLSEPREDARAEEEGRRENAAWNAAQAAAFAADASAAPPAPHAMPGQDREGGGSNHPSGGFAGRADRPFDDGGFGDAFD